MGTAGRCALGCKLCGSYDIVGPGSEEQSPGNTCAHRLVDSEQTKIRVHRHLRRHIRAFVIVDCICVSACTWISRRQSECVRSMVTTHGSPCRAALPILQPPLHALMPMRQAGEQGPLHHLPSEELEFLEALLLRSMARLGMPCCRVKRLHRLDGNFSTRD